MACDIIFNWSVVMPPINELSVHSARATYLAVDAFCVSKTADARPRPRRCLRRRSLAIPFT